MVFDLSDPTNPELTRTLNIGGEPWHPVYAPDGSVVYFPQRTTNSVAVIDATTWEVVDVFAGEGLAEPHGSAISADGRYLWVSGRNTNADYVGDGIPKTSDLTVEGGEPMPAGTVVAIDTTTGQIVTVLEVPAYAAGVGARAAR